jgi:hypothetical protein
MRLGFQKKKKRGEERDMRGFYRGFGVGKGQRFERIRRFCGVPIGFWFAERVRVQYSGWRLRTC